MSQHEPQNDWVQGGLKISVAALNAIEDAGRRAYERNEEACGYLSGPSADSKLCDEAVELENLANKYHQMDPEGHPRTGHDYFKIHSLRFEKAIAQGLKAERPVKVFFHSHLDCGAYFSEEDAASMTGGGTSAPAYDLAYLVSAVDAGQVSAHKLFIWNNHTKAFDEAHFDVV
ncbi:MAG: hypothetical protein RJA70_194 [Pseudomonadota bacterium]|jgi:proteasome lid subunit RPN8/RPN11